ncbi:PilN domain-containing protein [Sedimenticola hydrogenitrophicus]|uniref:PilN domain-containing protein n=1 Tax=Sedimenticola hydrogenitrophicus TaxID=2967975 RepID=UPI0021A312F8|nr:PilN domain-containing protein [Sedimenticola hydrogenitrophicus]
MAHINLLPWRETLRKKRQKDFGMSVLLALILTGAAAGGVHFYIEDMISHQGARNGYLGQEIAIVDKKIKEIQDLEKQKAQLIARMNVIQSLQGSRPQIVHLFDELVTTIPDGTHLTKLDQKGGAITLNGVAESNARVSAYMRNIDTSAWLGGPSLQVITSTERSKGIFTLTAKQIDRNKEKGDQQ